MPEKPAPMITISWSIIRRSSQPAGRLAVEEIRAVGHERRWSLYVLEDRLVQAPVEHALAVLAAADLDADLPARGHDGAHREDVAGLAVTRVAPEGGLADEPAAERDVPSPVVVDVDPLAVEMVAV